MYSLLGHGVFANRRFLAEVSRVLLLLCLASAALSDEPLQSSLFQVVTGPAGEPLRIETEAKINGSPVQLVFDTGTPENVVVSKAVAERTHLKLAPDDPANRIEDRAGVVFCRRAEPCELELGGRVRAYHRPWVAQELNGFDGLLGWPGGSENIYGFLLAERKVMVLQEVPPEVRAWTQFRVTDEDTVSLTPIGVAGTTVTLKTGAPQGVMLSSERWAAWKKVNPSAPLSYVIASGFGQGCVPILEESWTAAYPLNGFILREVRIAEAPPCYGLEKNDERIVLGLAALARLEIVLDGATNTAYVNPLNTPARPFRHNRLGAVFQPRGTPSEFVAHVAERSPADRAGLRTGDVLIAVNGTPWEDLPRIELLLEWDRPAGSEFEFSVRRGEKMEKISVVLEDILGPKNLPESRAEK